jgi:hypothetical protein
MSPEELLTADDHLSECSLCYETLDGAAGRAEVSRSITNALAVTKASDTIEHPSAEGLFDYTDQRLEPAACREIDAHLEACADCHGDVIELQSLALDLAAEPERTYGPRVNEADRLPAHPYWQALPVQLGLRVAGAGLLAAIVAWVAALPYKSRITRLERENARALEIKRELENQASSIQALQDEIAKLSRENEALRHTESQAAAFAVSLSEPGGVIEIGQDGAVRGLPSVDKADEQAVVAAMHSGRVVASPDLAGLRDKTGQLMGGSREPYGLVAPVATVVAEQQPNLRWNAVAGAASYVVSIYGDDFKVAARSEALRATEWKPGAALARGRTYTWQVRASVGPNEVVLPPPAEPEAKFKVLPGSELAELNRARSMYQGSHLMQGIIYARLGLLDDAERQLKALAKANPDSETARKLLASVMSLRHRR